MVGLYLCPPDNAMVICVDEKSQCQALERTQPMLPMGFGYVKGWHPRLHAIWHHDSAGGADVLDGAVLVTCKPRHRHQEYLSFLRGIDKAVPAELEVHCIVDNVSGWPSHLERRAGVCTIAPHLLMDGEQMEKWTSRRRHSAQFKAEVLAACAQPGASLASVALSFGLNANLVGSWRRGRGTKRAGDLKSLVPTEGLGCAAPPKFVALSLPPPPTTARALPAEQVAADIRLELRRGGLQVALSWPVASSAECAALLRDLLR